MFLGDVCGKGAPAAALTSLARYTLRTATAYTRDPAEVLDTLNTALTERYHGHNPRFCTIIFGLIEPIPDGGGCEITLASGGHPPALLLHSHGAVEESHTRGGQLIGAIPHAQIVTRSARLEAGDTLLLYTDGLTEARTEDHGGRYGDQALIISLGASRLSRLPVASKPSENCCTPSDPGWRTIPPFSRSTRYPLCRARRADPELGYRTPTRSVTPCGHK
ncbi:PP2C family protein-serine/threonine phosphatase [Nocardia asiatica]|uniref:PP2C family protein-serine/threonine phosphatase n=1 Tax=Nocardia asiatica TaxID=209252 RepID=UPI003EE029D2